MKKGRNEFWREIRETKQPGETQSYNFCAYRSYGNPYSCITAVKWDAYDVENTVGKATRCHLGRRILTAFIPVTGVKCSYGKIF